MKDIYIFKSEEIETLKTIVDFLGYGWINHSFVLSKYLNSQ